MTKRWLKLKDAAEYSCIGKQRLIKLAEAGAVKGFRDTDTKTGVWIFDKLSIDSYRESQYKETVSFAEDLLRRSGYEII